MPYGTRLELACGQTMMDDTDGPIVGDGPLCDPCKDVAPDLGLTFA